MLICPPVAVAVAVSTGAELGSQLLTLELNPNINFIVGDNGSGKSSVLSAIQVALGARSKATGQGQNFSNMVKYGAK